MKKITITFGDLFNILSLDTGVTKDTLYSNIPEMFIDTPWGKTKICGLVKKPIQEFVTVNTDLFKNEIQVSPNHIFVDENNKEVFAKNASKIKTRSGIANVTSIEPGIKKEPLYDLSIMNENAPEGSEELYYSANGVLHHNSFVGMKVAKNAQKKGLEVVYIDTEFAFDFGFADSIGIDNDKLMVIQDNQIESVQKTIMQMLEEIDKKDRDRLLILIDSWGGLVTSKTTTDALDGKDVSDMTVSKKKNMLARLLMGGPTVFVINQVYDSFDQYNPLAIAGGRGIYFASSSIVLGSSKAREKDSDGDISGAIVTATTKKSRSSKENTKLKYLIRYDGGIHPVFGILDDALECGVVEKPSMGWYTRPDVENDRKWREKDVWNNWEEFWPPILKARKFKKYIEDKYSFKESTIVDENFDFCEE